MTTTAKPAALDEDLREFLRFYYGKRLQRTGDLSQKACCALDTAERYGDVLRHIPAEVADRHYGCGCPIPGDDLTGLTVLDLGSGAGLDAFILSAKVGPTGFVHGVDMTEEQLAVARAHREQVARNLGYPAPNTAFHQDLIEVCESIPDGSIDLVVSNCVLNLSPRKDLVFATIGRVLREGGEFYIADIAADRRVPEEIRQDPEMVAECLGGALYEHDWFDLMEASGFRDARTVSRRVVQMEAKGLPIAFYSQIVRGFPLRRTAGPALRGLRAIRRLPGRLPRLGSAFRARRPPRLRGRSARCGVPQYGADAERDAAGALVLGEPGAAPLRAFPVCAGGAVGRCGSGAVLLIN